MCGRGNHGLDYKLGAEIQSIFIFLISFLWLAFSFEHITLMCFSNFFLHRIFLLEDSERIILAKKDSRLKKLAKIMCSDCPLSAWGLNYNTVLYCVRSKLLLALVRATNLCVRGSRSKWLGLGFDGLIDFQFCWQC